MATLYHQNEEDWDRRDRVVRYRLFVTSIVASIVFFFAEGFSYADANPHESVWPLTLQEAVQIGLAHNKEIAVVAPEPAIAESIIEFERGDFDPVVGIAVLGGQDDRQVRSNIANFGSGLGFQNMDYLRPISGRNQVYLKQRLDTGGFYEIGYGSQYARFSPVGTDLLLPSGWESSLNIEFAQPLLRGRGVEVTQRRVRIAAARARQSEQEFRERVREIIRDIDLAYWRLAGARKKIVWAQGFVKIATDTVEQEIERDKQGLSARPQMLQVNSLLTEFKISLANSIREAGVAEVALRKELGLAQFMIDGPLCHRNYDPIYDLQIDTVSEPVAFVSQTELNAAISRSMSRPELMAVQAKIEEARASLAAARNQLLPDISAQAFYSKTGLAKGLDDASSNLLNDRFGVWGAGVAYERRLTQRSERAEVRQWNLELAKSQAKWNQIAHDLVAELRSLVATIDGFDTMLTLRDAQIKLLQENQEALDLLYKDEQTTLFQRLENMRLLQNSTNEAIETWVQRNLELAKWRFESRLDAASYGLDLAPLSASSN